MAYLISSKCVKCHACRMECPVTAIGFKGIDYVIDPVKCTNCGHCAEICPVCAIIDTSIPETVPEKHELRRLSCDLVVVGGGGSGLVAAVKAAQMTGKKVIVLEKAKKVGGSTTLAHGFGVHYSRWQKEAGFSDTRNDVIQQAIENSKGLIDAELLKKTVYSTGPFFDWLCEFGGAESAFTIETGAMGPYSTPAVLKGGRFGFPDRKFANLKCEDPTVGPGWMGTYVIVKMMEQCEKLGIMVLTEHAAAKLLTDQSGKIYGVLANDPGGQTQIDCKVCVIASGGFSYNRELVMKVRPEFFDVELVRQCVPTNTGDGIIMAEGIGAQIDYKNALVVMAAPAHHPFGYACYRFLQQSETVIINLDGRRFTSEHQFETKQRDIGNFYKQRDGLAYAIIDNALIEKYVKRLLANPPDGNDGWILEKYREEIEENLKNTVAIKRADTFEGLARQFAVQFGTDPAVMVAELRKYNEFCSKGVDEDFGKDPKYLVRLENPPYYAFYAQGFSEGTYGGIVTDVDMQVLDTEGKKIPGLYAVGDIARGFNRVVLKGAIPISTLTWAVTSGYMAGIEAAKYIRP